MVRGGDDPIYARLAIRAVKLSSTKQRGIRLFGKSALTHHLLANSIWIVIGIDKAGNEIPWGTAFSLDGIGIVSARHVIDSGKKHGAYRWELRNAAEPVKKHPVTAFRAAPNLDLAVFESSATIVGALCRDTRNPQVGDRLSIVGFPNWYNVTDKLSVEPTDIVQTKHVGGLLHILTKGTVHGGNSGGPFLSNEGYVTAVVIWDGTSPIAPHGGLAIDHIDRAASAPIQVI
jgi:hypothetical protein